MKKLILLLSFTIFFIWALSSTAFGATFTVTKTADTNDGTCDSDCSLREAVAAANSAASSDTIQFDSQVFIVGQSIALLGAGLFIENNGSLEIIGPGAHLLSILGSSQTTAVIGTTTSAPVTISDLTVANGNGGGISNFGNLTLTRLVVKNNRPNVGSGSSAGGIFTQGNLVLNSCTVTANAGIGVRREGGTTQINSSLISGNSGTGFAHQGTSTMSINDSTITGNGGGGIGLSGGGGGSLTLHNSTVSGNYGATQGAGVSVFSTALILNNSSVVYNRGVATNGAGIIVNGSGTVSARNSIIAQNTGSSVLSDMQGILNSQGYNLIGTTAFLTITGDTTGNLLNVDPKLLPLASIGGATPTHALDPVSPAIDAGDPANVIASDQRGITRPADGNNDGTSRPDIGPVEAGSLVTNTNDSGSGSLRQAIADANSTAANEEIRFSALFNTPQTILLASGELNISGGGLLLINGPGRDKLTVSGNDQHRVLLANGEANASIRNLSISDGRTVGGNGAGISNVGSAILELIDLSVLRNSAPDGGGIFNSGAMIIRGSSISLNNALGGDGGGIRNSAGTLTISNSTISQNSALNGGGIRNEGTVRLSYTVVENNVATNAGGGVFHFSGTASGDNSFALANTAGSSGGGIAMRGSVLSLRNSTVSGNTATNATGGGVDAISGTTTITNVTVALNGGQTGGGISNGSGSIFNAQNSLIARNFASSAAADWAGSLSSQGYNLVGNAAGSTITGNTTGNLLNVDPLLLPLAANGGFTQTHALAATSPAVDSGDPVKLSAVDQRGNNRVTDGNGDGTIRTDIGSYELGTVVANTNNDGPGSLRQAVLDAITGVGEDVINLSPAFDTPQTVVLTSGELSLAGGGSLTINGRGNLTISGNNQTRVFNVGTFANLTLNGVRVISGRVLNGDGGGILNLGALTINDSSITGNTCNGGGSTPRGGAGIYNNGGSLRLVNSAVNGNVLTGGDGGGILNNVGTVNLAGSSVNNNSGASNGGGIFNASGNVTLTDSGVISNSASRSGGIRNDGTLNLLTSRVSSNIGQQLYGGIYNGGIATIETTTISGNRTPGDGGGIFNLGTLFLSKSTLSDNIASRGGGINNNGGTNNDVGKLTVLNSTISRNQATTSGGGMYTVGGIVDLTCTTFAFNTATNTGGGILNFSSPVNSRNTLISQNTIGSTQAPSDFAGAFTSQGYNLIGNTSGTSITGSTSGNQLNIDPQLDPILRENSATTKTHALRSNSPAIDAGNSTLPETNTDQRGLLRPFDFQSLPNAPGGNGGDIGSFERQPSDVIPSTSFDVDGDLKTDLSIFRPAGTNGSEWWWLKSSTGGNAALQFGSATDKMVPVDYTGDGKTDVAFWRPETGQWFVLRSEDFSFYAFPFGATGDVPVPADYDGDGKADAAVFRESSLTWFISKSSGGTDIVTFGAAGDKPVNADYDGDGKSDIAIFRPNGGSGAEWWVRRSSNASVFALQFGTSTDKAVPGDFTGDGKADVAFWRPSTGFWNILRSEDFSYYAFPFGANGDVASPGDYDGDGKLDAAVFRPSSSTWYANRSTAGVLIQQFGITGDLPLPNAFVR